MSDKLDERDYANKRKRLRFRLTREAKYIVDQVFKSTGYQYNHSALELISADFQTFQPVFKLVKPVEGKERLIVKLYPGQVESVKSAFELAKDGYTTTYAGALVYLCLYQAYLGRFMNPELWEKAKTFTGPLKKSKRSKVNLNSQSFLRKSGKPDGNSDDNDW
ncbi:hypothetical protein QSV34_10685 [Porticoccus sp. W117]|uniref:hypothetical protein n=1 Tax=Porticoccus sp. W117 TaxID=3054777 RepID=UPI002595B01B|nr:hypothetical protein [Porticoccus sp. W117]MDM3871817.1 hypothetical protein [Porticoccus sp. W117]